MNSVILTALLLVGLIEFGFAHFNYDVKTKSGLTNIYNERVVHVERMHRPMSSSGGSANVPFVHHQGVRVTTDHGNK